MSFDDLFETPEVGPSEEDLAKLRNRERLAEEETIRQLRSRSDVSGRTSLISPGVGLNVPGVNNE